MGKFTHIGLEDTADTIGACQVNQQTGIETSWLSPSDLPSTTPGPVVIHKPSQGSRRGQWNHVTWSGKHEVLIPRIVANTLGVSDDQTFSTISGTYCATAGCGCSLPKLTEAIKGDIRGLQVPNQKQQRQMQTATQMKCSKILSRLSPRRLPSIVCLVILAPARYALQASSGGNMRRD